MASNDILVVHLPEQSAEGKRLGRHVQHDPRLRDCQARRAPEIVSVQHQATGLPVNQGDLGSCTANALCGALDSAPDFIWPRQRARFLPGTRTAKRRRTR
jgi:hypothetical protein